MDTERFVSLLERLPSYKGAFNPWAEVDTAHDRGNSCPAIRRRQLACFLGSRQGKARHLIIGEASGYQGCHFTGIPMTSERILLGWLRERGIPPEAVLSCVTPERTSRPAEKPSGFSEPTATIVWDAIMRWSPDPLGVCIWNTVPQHLYNPAKGMLSNRNPTREEIARGEKTLSAFLRLFPRAEVIAMGNAAAAALGHLGIAFTKVRHPSQGGSKLFREQIRNVIARP